MRHLLAGYDLSTDRLYGHIKKHKGRTEFFTFVRYLRSLHPPNVRIAIVLDNFAPHLSTTKDRRVGQWVAANNVELAYTPHYASWLNRIEAQFQALRYFALDGTDHPSHHEQARMIRRYIAWRNRNAHDQALRELVKRANVAWPDCRPAARVPIELVHVPRADHGTRRRLPRHRPRPPRFRLFVDASVDSFTYTFDALTDITLGLLDQLGLDRFALYVQDYGAPIGFRIASRNPARITALITQNGNAYVEGFTAVLGWPLRVRP